MQLSWLEDFIAVARLRNFGKAAQARHISQPAFGRRIKELESWLGVSLIDRSAYPTQLTEAGSQFLLTAQEIVKTLEVYRQDLQGSQQAEDDIRIATGHTLGHTHFPAWLVATKREAGEFQTTVWSGSLHDALLRLEQGAADLVLCYGHSSLSIGLESTKLESVTVGCERLVAVSGAEPKGVAKHQLDQARLAPTAHLALAPDLAQAKILAASIPGATYKKLNTVHTSDSAQQLLHMVRSGVGMAWLPMTIVADDLTAGNLVRVQTAKEDIVCEVRLARQVARTVSARHRLIDKIWAANSNHI